MLWSYATYLPAPVFPPELRLRDHVVVVGLSVPNAIPQAALVAGPSGRTIPLRPLVLSPLEFNQIAPSTFPRQFNRFDYSADFVIPFNRRLVPGTPVRMRWTEWNLTTLHAQARYQVAPCWLAFVRTRTEIAVLTREPRLVVEQLRPSKWFLTEDGVVLVAEHDRKIGEHVVLPVE
jgi:hypothetical protein